MGSLSPLSCRLSRDPWSLLPGSLAPVTKEQQACGEPLGRPLSPGPWVSSLLEVCWGGTGPPRSSWAVVCLLAGAQPLRAAGTVTADAARAFEKRTHNLPSCLFVVSRHEDLL